MHYLQCDTNATYTIHDIAVRYDCIQEKKESKVEYFPI